MQPTLRIRIDSTSVERELRRIKDQLDDLRPLWPHVRQEFLIHSILNVFATDGRGTWRPTARPNPILRDTRALFRSYTIAGAPGNINKSTARRLIWGSSIHYAPYHEFGTRNLPQRQVIGLLGTDVARQQLSAIVDRWVSGVVR